MAKAKEAPAPTQTTDLYGGQVHLDFYEKYGRKKHVYLLNGQEVPSVTRVLDVLAKGWLAPWALNCMESALLTSWQPGRTYDELTIRDLLRKAKAAKDEISSTAKDVGTVAHDWIEQYIKAQINDTPHPDLPFAPAIKTACEAFLAWESCHEISWLESEKRIASREHGFAGTMDFEAQINGELVVGDLKTNKSIEPEHWIQTAAYQLAREEELASIGRRYDKRMILRLGKEPSLSGVEFEVQERRDFETDKQLFLAALQLQKGLTVLNSFKGDCYEQAA